MPDTTGSSVIISTVCPAEQHNGILFRCFESLGKEASLSLPGNRNTRWIETDLLEEHPREVTEELRFRPFEIKTLIRLFPETGNAEC